MRKTLLILGISGLLSQFLLSGSSGIMASGNLVGGSSNVYQMASPYPIRVPVERRAPWWKFWKDREVTYQPAYPVTPSDQTEGVAIIQPPHFAKKPPSNGIYTGD